MGRSDACSQRRVARKGVSRALWLSSSGRHRVWRSPWPRRRFRIGAASLEFGESEVRGAARAETRFPFRTGITSVVPWLVVSAGSSDVATAHAWTSWPFRGAVDSVPAPRWCCGVVAAAQRSVSKGGAVACWWCSSPDASTEAVDEAPAIRAAVALRSHAAQPVEAFVELEQLRQRVGVAVRSLDVDHLPPGEGPLHVGSARAAG